MKTRMLLAAGMMLCGAASAVPKESTGATPVSPNVRGHEDTEWSIAYGYGLVHNARKPRVFLVGDSITAQYVGEVARLLKEKGMTTSYWASSYCLTSPCYLKFLDAYLSEADYAVIHFNNGLHSLGTPTEAWTDALRKTLTFVRTRCPNAKVVWTTSTPLKDAKATEKVREINAAAAKVVAEFGDIATDNLFAAMDPLDREENWSDKFHFKDAAKKIQAEQVAAACLKAAAIVQDGK